MQCEGCGGRISVDDGFAGGVCRCPYCKQTVIVEGQVGQGGNDQTRPDEPPKAKPVDEARQTDEPVPVANAEQPPEAGQASSETVSPGHGHQPRASRANRAKRIQIVILSVLIMLAVGLGGVIYILAAGTGEGETTPETVSEPSGPIGPGGGALELPVIFIVDAGDSMDRYFDPAMHGVIESLQRMDAEARANVYVCREGFIEKAAESLVSPETLLPKVQELTRGTIPSGTTKESIGKAIDQALEAEPAQIVLMLIKGYKDQGRAEKIKQSPVSLIVMPMASRAMVRYAVDDLEAFSRAAGGTLRFFE
jgi:hypothetical protein